jgi:Malic enzyme, N-terminal domain
MLLSTTRSVLIASRPRLLAPSAITAAAPGNFAHPSASSGRNWTVVERQSFSTDPPPPSSPPPPIMPWEVPEEEATGGEWEGCRQSFIPPIQISARGAEILHNPLFNKGTAFKSGERDRLRFRGLLPHRIMNIHKQKERFLRGLRDLDSNIRKNIMLEDLHDRNETLYHRILVDHIDEMAPLIYTPTVGQACQDYGVRFRRPRGMYFTEEDRGQMAAM